MVEKEQLFVETRIPQQKTIDGVLFPAAISPNGSVELDVDRFTDAIKSEKPRIEELLYASGAVLLRGFPVRTAAEFDRAVEAFGYDEFPYIGGTAPRINVVGRVYTANEAAPDHTIHFHHEMSQLPRFPSKLFFFCEEEPRSGGETPIVLGHRVYEKMKEKYPEFMEKLERLGLIYIRVLGTKDDPSVPTGRGWQSAFSTKDKSTAEERAAERGVKLEWLKDGAKMIMGPLPAIRVDESRNRNIWYMSMVSAYTFLKDARNETIRGVTFGDGTSFPADIIDDCSRILEEESVAVPWKKGDILLLDNLAVLHSRRPFDPPRRVLASLCV